MSNRSYPADFSRPLRETPVATDADVQRMLERLRRRCKVGKVSVNGSNGKQVPLITESAGSSDAEEQSGKAGDAVNYGLVAGSTPALHAVAVANLNAEAEHRESSVRKETRRPEPFGSTSAPDLAPASSAGHPSSASASVVNGAAEITTKAGGGPHEAGVNASPPFQPTRPAPLVWERISPTAMRTTCGTWTCAKVTWMGRTTYELWRRVAGLERPVCVRRGIHNFDLAKQVAQNEMDADDGSANSGKP